MKACTFLLMCGLSLAGAAAADPIGAPRRGPDGWIFGRPGEGYELPRRMPPVAAPQQDSAAVPQPPPHTAVPQRQAHTATIPLPRPRPDGLETTGAIEIDASTPATAPAPAVTPTPAAVPMPQPTPSAATGPPNASTPQPAPAPLSATGQGAAKTPTSAAIGPAKDTDGAAMPPVSVRDAGGGRIQIEAHDASVGQVLAALQDSHLVRLIASDPPSGTVTGTYTGTVPQILSRILDGHDYFLRVTASGTELHAVSASGDAHAALRGAISSSSADAAAEAAPGSSLSPANPVSQTHVRVTPSPAAKARKRAH